MPTARSTAIHTVQFLLDNGALESYLGNQRGLDLTFKYHFPSVASRDQQVVKHKPSRPGPGQGEEGHPLTIGVLVGQPVVPAILEFKVRVSLLALLGSEVLEVFLAFFCVTKLVLKINTRTILAAIDGPKEKTTLNKPLGCSQQLESADGAGGQHARTAELPAHCESTRAFPVQSPSLSSCCRSGLGQTQLSVSRNA